jgi:hypothetical protein
VMVWALGPMVEGLWEEVKGGKEGREGDNMMV